MSFAPAALLPIDWWALSAVIVLSVGVLVLLLLELLPRREGSDRAAIISLVTLVASAVGVLTVADARRTLFGGMFVHDGFTVFFTVLFCAIGVVGVLLSWDYLKRTDMHQSAEYYALMLSATLGMIIMAASNDLITIFLGLELMSLALYILVGFRRNQLESNEAALKYFLLGAFATGFVLYGIALIYGATGSTNLTTIGAFLAETPVLGNPLLVVGGLLLVIGLSFKVAAVPFHMWAPDAYQGAPTSITAFMAAGAKAAGFAALLRVGIKVLYANPQDWTTLLAVVAGLTMTVGNVTALMQTNLKRLLAYSSIAHAGYVLVAVVAGGADGASAALFYLVVYSLSTLGSFGILTLLGRGQDERVQLADLAGLGFRQPVLGLAMTFFMLSLGGIPPTAGFMGKVYVFGTAVTHGHVALAIIGVLNSVVSVFYYLRVTVAMYMQEPQGEPVSVSWAVPSAIALIATLALTLWWGVQAHGLLEQAQRSVLGLL